ncbi:MAG: MTH895/ArsE family thioredoxin-like protein [Acidobacteriota bacterium]
MKVEVLGPGCPKCKKLYESALEAKKELPADVDVVKVEEIGRMTQVGMWSSPGLVVDGSLVSQGRLLSSSDIVKLVRERVLT